MQVEASDEPFIVLIELQLHYDATMPARMQNYAAMARQKYGLPVLPIVVYLTPPPTGTEVATFFHSEFRGQVTHQDFAVMKLWELDAHAVLQQPLLPASLLPYVPLMAGANEAVVRECVRRLRREENHEELETILALFAMIKFDEVLVTKIVRWHVTILEKSPIYQEILAKGVKEGLARGLERGREVGREEGREEGLRRSILRVLGQRLGEVPADLEVRLLPLTAVQLESLLDDALTAPDFATFAARMDAQVTER